MTPPSTSSLPPFKPLPMKGPSATVERRADGSILLRSNHAPGDGPRSIAHLLQGARPAAP
jgi:feruloyl-CoA synthase